MKEQDMSFGTPPAGIASAKLSDPGLVFRRGSFEE